MDVDINAIISRVKRIFTFDLTVFQEVEADQTATRQAWVVVAVAAVASAIGSAIGSLISGGGFVGLLIALILTPIFAIAGYFVWAFVTSWVGVNMFQGQTDFEEMQRVIGFAYAPNALGFFSFIPCVGWLASLAGGLYALALSVLAVKEGLDVDWVPAIITCVIGWIANFVLLFIPSLIVGLVIGGATAALS
ncbi:MAG: YIP1 family protein [Chloroflexota bacterium]